MPPDTRDLKWVTIDDFSPGIISQSRFAYSNTTSPVPAKQPGAAQVNGTSSCIALPNGGLAPLPGIQKSVQYGQNLPGGGGITFAGITGAVIYGPINVPGGATTGDELLYLSEAIQTSGAKTIRLLSYQEYLNTTTSVTSVTGTVTTGFQYFPFTGGLTRVNTSTPANAGQACVALCAEPWFSGGNSGYQWLYPNPSSPTAFGVYSFGTSYPGQGLTHQNRFVVLSAGSTSNNEWPPTNTLLVNNEVFYYTDPPNSNTMGTQQSVFVQEHPFGYGAWGSISAGELFLVKNAGGGVVISGDLNFPTVTYLGGVTPTYGIICDAAETTIGLVYASNNNGVWTWNGASQSSKISDNLNDDFFKVTGGQTAGPLSANAIHFSATQWGSWLCMTNGWLFDLATNSWWRLPSPTFAGNQVYYGVSWDGSGCWVLTDAVTGSSSNVAAKYSYSTPSTTYTWTSHPIQASLDKDIQIQEVAVRAQGIGTVGVTYTGLSGATSTSSPTSLTFNSLSQPQLLRLAVGASPAQDVTITITSTGTGGNAAPIVYSVSTGYKETYPSSAT